MLGEAFEVITALDVVEATRIAAVIAGVNAAYGVDLQAEGVAAALGKNLVAAGLGVIAPDELAHRVNGGLIDAVVFHAAGHRAALASVEPAVRSPLQAVGAGMGILQA